MVVQIRHIVRGHKPRLQADIGHFSQPTPEILTYRTGTPAVEMLKAVDAKDTSAVLTLGARLDQACENCHVKFWYLQKQR